MLNTPVLFIIFNRPETTRQVFEAIRKAKPRQLFVAADGPRAGKEGEKERCDEARRIATNVDWDCEVKTLFRAENIGCGKGPAEAITWFFDNVEQGIILEDDCLPVQSFFPYCEFLLDKFKTDENVYLVSGTNMNPAIKSIGSYFFSKYAGIWGWATWRRAWENFKYNVPELNDGNSKESVLKKTPIEIQKYVKGQITAILAGNLEAWDYQWWFYRIKADSVGIIPSVNLISNIGFGSNATHTFDINSPLNKLETGELTFPLKPAAKFIHKEYDKHYYNLFFGSKNALSNKIVAKIVQARSGLKRLFY